MNGISAAPSIGARALTRPRLSPRAREALAFGALVLLTATGLGLAVTAAGGRTFDVPASHRGMPAWLGGPFHVLHAPVLTADQFVLALGLMTVLWLALLAFGGTLQVRWIVAAVVLLHVVFALAPPVMSKDVFSYISYARLGILHGRDPYTVAAAQFPGDPAYPYLGWRFTGSAYGPLFTLASYPLGLVSVPAALWITKIVTAIFSGGLVWFAWRLAGRLGLSQVGTLLWVGLNPLVVIYGVGGAHNDLIMLFLMLVAIAVTLERRDAVAAGSIVAGAAVKATAAAMLPYMLLRPPAAADPALGAGRPDGVDQRARLLPPERRQGILGAVVAAAAVVLLSAAAFNDAFGVFRVLKRQQLLVSGDAIPNQIAKLLGFSGVTSDVRLVVRLLLLSTLLWLLWLVWRGLLDWITATGWAMVMFVLTSSWLLGWYVLWPLPFAALSRDRRLRIAAAGLVVYFVVQRWSTFIT